MPRPSVWRRLRDVPPLLVLRMRRTALRYILFDTIRGIIEEKAQYSLTCLNE